METNGNQSPEIKRDTRSRSRSPLNSPQERNHSSSRDSSSTRERDRSQRNRRNVGDGRRGGGGGGNDDRRSRAPSNRRVYVANIPYDCKWTDIKDIFREKVGDVSYVELFEDHDGKFRGCGIVEFKDNAAVQKAIDVLHRYEIKGRHLVVKEDFDVERDKTGRPITRSSMNRADFNANIPPLGDSMGGDGLNSQFNTYGLSPHFLESLGINGPLTNRVFVANLDYKVTDKKLQDIFKMAGKVISIELKTDKEGKSKGHGIVEFDHPVEAVQAISMFNGQKLFTRSMSVRMDKYKEESDGIPTKLPAGLQGIGKGLGSGGQPINISSAGGPLNTMQGGLGAMGMGMGGAPAMGTANLGMMAGAAAMGMGNMGGMSGTAGGMGLGMGMNMQGGMGADRSLMGGNMGSGMGNMGMAGAVGNMGLGSRSASGMMNVSGMGGGGNGMVGGASMNAGMGGGAGGMGSNMSVGMGSGINSGMGMGGSMGMAGGGAGGGNSMDGFGDYDRGNDSYRSPRSSDTVVVRNLPTSYNWQTLRDRFKDIGDVRYTEVKGRGTAVVRFGTERDAQRAVDLMHGIRIDGRPIEVQLY